MFRGNFTQVELNPDAFDNRVSERAQEILEAKVSSERILQRICWAVNHPERLQILAERLVYLRKEAEQQAETEVGDEMQQEKAGA